MTQEKALLTISCERKTKIQAANSTHETTTSIATFAVDSLQIYLSQFSNICALFHLHLEGETSQWPFKSCLASFRIGSKQMFLPNFAFFSYSACIRRAAGYCCIEYQVCPNQNYAFSLDGSIAAKGLVDTLCLTDYVAIPGNCKFTKTINKLGQFENGWF